MQKVRDRVVYSASDLNNYVECPHITELDKRLMAGEIAKPTRPDRIDVIAEYGRLHEQRYLDSLRATGAEVIEIERTWGEPGWIAGEAKTAEAMARGVPYIAQATFYDGTWLGYADVIKRVETPCPKWDWSYEAVDAKLARSDKPYFILQLCNYSEQLARIQGTAPQHMWLYLGTPEEKRYRYNDFAAFYRKVKQRFLRIVGTETDTYPYAVPFCETCRYDDVCTARRESDDHPSLVAYARRDQIERLAEGRPPIATVAALAVAEDAMRPPDMATSTFNRLRSQADIQVRSRDAGKPLYELLPTHVERGLAILPQPDPGDVFFDMEGDPFVERGLEYLFGCVTIHDGGPVFSYFWADDADQEKVCFERFVDFVGERRSRYPNLHVYHYAAYEPSALKRLVTKHSTREDELDVFLRDGVFVDLFTAVRQGLLVPGYSIKDVEKFFRDARTGDVATAVDSVLAFEKWRAEHDDHVKHEILDYNRIDCESTLKLRDWLLARRREAFDRFGEPAPLRERERKPPSDLAIEFRQRLETIETSLLTIESLQILAQLLNYHRREDKPVWWEFYERCAQTPEALVEDPACVGMLERASNYGPVPEKRSLIYRFAFPPQQHKFDVGDTAFDNYGNRIGTVFEVDDDRGLIALKRVGAFEEERGLRALIPRHIIGAKIIVGALLDFAESELSAFPSDATPFRAGHAILHRERPRVNGIPPGTELQRGDIEIEVLKALCRALDESHLFIQGPPGSGKTWAGARLIVDLLKQGCRVGVSGPSHKAINNLLAEVETVAVEEGHDFRGIKKDGGDDHAFESVLDQPMITSTTDKDACLDDDVELVAGTAWLFSDPALRRSFDYLFIDEAGQVSLANALAMSTAAKNVVLLGDPLQLANVSHGEQPEGAGASVLEHLLGEEATIPSDRGIFLTRSYRMHPKVCGFVSETIYEGRLASAPECEVQRVDAIGFDGAGLRFIGIDHDGDPTRSREEADAVVTIVGDALGGTYTATTGETREMAYGDILVVAPYNAQVKLIGEALARAGYAAVRVGTVDKFQGQQAPVVIYSMATPSAADVPHGLEFLFSQNRLNVAISRAKCWSIIVASPRLLDANCRTVDQMRLINSLCKFVEHATKEDSGTLSVV